MTATTILTTAFQSATITPLKRTLAADTSAIAFNVSATTGATPPASKPPALNLWWAASTVDLAAAAAPAALASCAKALPLNIPLGASQQFVMQSETEIPLGSNLYLWSDTPDLSQAITVTVDLVEI